jgi:hypothetical protein
MNEHIQLDFSVLKKTIIWWEKKRIWFNVIIGVIGILAVYMYCTDAIETEDIIGIILWGIMANILYSVGILLEIVNQYYLKGKLNIFRFRHVFFILGTLMYMFVTWNYAFYYYYPHFVYMA